MSFPIALTINCEVTHDTHNRNSQRKSDKRHTRKINSKQYRKMIRKAVRDTGTDRVLREELAERRNKAQ